MKYDQIVLTIKTAYIFLDGQLSFESFVQVGKFCFLISEFLTPLPNSPYPCKFGHRLDLFKNSWKALAILTSFIGRM